LQLFASGLSHVRHRFSALNQRQKRIVIQLDRALPSCKFRLVLQQQMCMQLFDARLNRVHHNASKAPCRQYPTAFRGQICDFIETSIVDVRAKHMEEKPSAKRGKQADPVNVSLGHDKFLLTRLGETIQKRRGEIGLSQEQVCGQTEMNRTYLSDIERGVSNPSFLVLWKLSSALQVELWQLLQGVDLRDRPAGRSDSPEQN
jgi:ribosome-binding protein aMBF1 (putative translation factor)